MAMILDEQTRMIQDTVRKFVEREMLPLEAHVMKNQLACDDGAQLTDEEKAGFTTYFRDFLSQSRSRAGKRRR